MISKKIKISDKVELNFIEKVYMESFPENERRPFDEFVCLIDAEKSFSVCLFSENEIHIGFLTYWEFESFIFVEHFAISPQFRNDGHGRKIIDFLKNETTLPLILEVELSDTNEFSQRRIRFYERQGFNQWDTYYEQPPYTSKYKPQPMILMIYRGIGLNEKKEKTKSLIHKKVYNSHF